MTSRNKNDLPQSQFVPKHSLFEEHGFQELAAFARKPPPGNRGRGGLRAKPSSSRGRYQAKRFNDHKTTSNERTMKALQFSLDGE